MPVAYRFNEVDYKYEGEIERQLDPVASEKAGEDIYMVPGSSTLVTPLEPQDGLDIVWNPAAEIWEYKQIKRPEEAKPYTPTELDKAYDAMYEAKLYLSNTDYINDKINDAMNTGDEELAAELRVKYADTFAERAKVRAEVRRWEAEIERLTAEESAD